MHRTQIYLLDDMYERLKARSLSRGVSISELIRQAVRNQYSDDQSGEARAYFDRLEPLESFGDRPPETFVRELRATSRLGRNDWGVPDEQD